MIAEIAWSLSLIIGFILGAAYRGIEIRKLRAELQSEQSATDFMVKRLADTGINIDKIARGRVLEILLERRRQARKDRAPAAIRGWDTRRRNEKGQKS